jgi:hypothetical protein
VGNFSKMAFFGLELSNSGELHSRTLDL